MMKSLLAAVFLAVFAAEIAVDSFDASCVGTGTEQACHACLCATPSMPTVPGTVQRIPLARPTLVSASFDDLVDHLADKSLFRPPKALA